MKFVVIYANDLQLIEITNHNFSNFMQWQLLLEVFFLLPFLYILFNFLCFRLFLCFYAIISVVIFKERIGPNINWKM